MKKLGIIIVILLHVIVGFAQRSITVGAKIETDFQIWYLDSIVLSNDSTTLKWHVESKGNTYACMSLLPALVDPGTMKEYYMKHVWGIAKEPDKTSLNREKCAPLFQRSPVSVNQPSSWIIMVISNSGLRVSI